MWQIWAMFGLVVFWATLALWLILAGYKEQIRQQDQDKAELEQVLDAALSLIEAYCEYHRVECGYYVPESDLAQEIRDEIRQGRPDL